MKAGDKDLSNVKYDRQKMKRLIERDQFMKFVYTDLMARSHSEETALEVIFNGYVLEDSVMEQAYEQA